MTGGLFLLSCTSKSGLVTIPGKLSDDIAIGTLKNILKQAQLNLDTN